MTQSPEVLKLHPRFISRVLTPDRHILQPGSQDPKVQINPKYNYDPEVLRMMLGSVPLPIDGLGITVNSDSDVYTVGKGAGREQRTLRYGQGLEGALRATFKRPRYDIPGDIWVMVSEHYDASDSERDLTEIGLVPLQEALEMIDVESRQRRLPVEFPEIPQADMGRRPVRTEVHQVLVLPETISRYMSELQVQTRSKRRGNEDLNITEFRNRYFNLDPSNPDLSSVFKQIRGEYLGKTTWESIVALDVLMRILDFGIGSLPFIGPVRDSLQSMTGKEFVIPGIERAVRHILQEKGFNLPENMFEKPLKGRLMEIADTIIGLGTSLGLLIPGLQVPAFISSLTAKPFVDLGLEGLQLVNKLEQSRKTFKPFNRISKETGTQPDVLKKIEHLQELNIKEYVNQKVKNFGKKVGQSFRKNKKRT